MKKAAIQNRQGYSYVYQQSLNSVMHIEQNFSDI
jgi:hypothetical protein